MGYYPGPRPGAGAANLFRVIGNIYYYVGPSGLSAHLITAPEGHILIDSGFEQTAPR